MMSPQRFTIHNDVNKKRSQPKSSLEANAQQVEIRRNIEAYLERKQLKQELEITDEELDDL